MSRSLAWIWAVTLVLTACGEDFSAAGGGGEGGSAQGGSSSGTGGSGGNGTSSGIGGSPVECPASTVWAPPVEASWDGPMILARSAEEGSLPDCSGGGGQVLHVGLQGDDPAGCSCACGTPDPESCVVVVDVWGNATCAGNAADTVTLDPGCQNLNGQGLVGAVKWLSAPPQDGACAITSETTLSTLSWSGHMQVCDGDPTMVEGEICLAIEAGFDAQACVVKAGSSACPAGYPVQRVGFSDISDQRGCSECTCNTSTASCVGHVTVFGAGACGSGDGGNTINSNTCTPLSTSTALTAIAYQPATAGSCTAAGGEPVGLVEKSGAYTVCCTE